MEFKRFINRERILWHKHFIPSLFAGLIVAFISFLFDLTVSNVVLFASVGASAVILANSYSHHLTKLRTTIFAYTIAIVLSSLVFLFNLWIPLHTAVNIFLLIFLVSIFLFLFNVFHPPAVTSSLSFLLLKRPLIDLVLLFIAILILLILIRFFTYTLSQRLSIKKFAKEFKRNF